MSDVGRNVSIICSNADEDKEMVKKLITHMVRKYSIWYDDMIPPGEEHDRQILEHLKTADIILLLVSADFMASDFCYLEALRWAMTRHSAGEATVIPIILRPILWKDETPFGSLDALPNGARAVTLWTNQDEAYNDIVNGIPQKVREKQKKQYILEAEQHIENKRYDYAINTYNNVLSLFSDDADIHKLLGDVFYKSDKLGEALAYYNKAITFGLKDVQIYLSKGAVLYELKQFKDALSTYEEALKLFKDNAAIYEKIGDILYFICDMDNTYNAGNHLKEALEMYKQASILEKSKVKLTELLQKKVSIYASLMKVNRVMIVKTCQEALENGSGDDPEKVLLLRNAGYKLVSLDRLEEALEMFDKAISLDAGDAEPHKEKGDVLLQMKRLPEALAAYNQAIHLKPDYDLARKGRQDTLEAMKKYKREISTYLRNEEQRDRRDKGV